MGHGFHGWYSSKGADIGAALAKHDANCKSRIRIANELCRSSGNVGSTALKNALPVNLTKQTSLMSVSFNETVLKRKPPPQFVCSNGTLFKAAAGAQRAAAKKIDSKSVTLIYLSPPIIKSLSIDN